MTWADAAYLAGFREDIEALRPQVDILVASCHWGLGRVPLQYMTDIAHAAIDAGADVVMGHGPHVPLAIEIYRGKPVFYGLGSFCFMRSNKKVHKGWVGMMALVAVEGKRVAEAAFSLVRQKEDSAVCACNLGSETEALARIQKLSDRFGTPIRVQGERAVVWSAARREDRAARVAAGGKAIY